MTTLDRLDATPRAPAALAVGAVAQLGLLAALAADGLGPVGWLAGLIFTAVLCAILAAAVQRAAGVFGPADQVTLARATLVGGVTALVVDDFAGSPASRVLLVALASVALAMDAVDGAVARRTGTSSPLGARFDMEVDAFLILVLSAFVAADLGGWVLAIGVMRYAFVAAAAVLPWLRSPLFASRSRKVVAAWQGVTLAAAAAGLLPVWLTAAGVAVSLGLLLWSFARDIRWLHARASVASTA